jgi:phosphatidylglycerol:prolipoprotein diacylglycerol transferase
LYPFIHIGPLTLGTYGLMVAVGLICAFFILRADFARRRVSADAEAIIGITGLAGLAGSRLYHLLQDDNRRAFFDQPWALLFSTMGFAFEGAIIGGFLALVFLAKRFRISVLLMLDAASPAAAIGYGIGRIGCLISGDGDYGIPTSLPWGMSFPNGIVPTTQRVHPTPIYEFVVALVIFWILWRIGARGLKTHAPSGIIFAVYLVLSGIARFLVELIRINPCAIYWRANMEATTLGASPPPCSLQGLTNAQAASVVSVVAGILLFIVCRSKPAAARTV